MSQALDQEWVELILLAKEMGLTIEEVRDFLQASEQSLESGKIAI